MIANIHAMKTRVFLSWSGERSQMIANALHQWLPAMINGLDVRFSQEFIKPGEMWPERLTAELNRCSLGIFCLTPENIGKPWMLFEAGAISKGSKTRVCPVLWGFGPEKLDGLPYKNFQAVRCDRNGICKLVTSLNSLLPAGQKRGDVELMRSFDAVWGKLRHALRDLDKVKVSGDGATMEHILHALKAADPDDKIHHDICTNYQFSSGFENFGLYQAVANIAKKRLWILGRKNRKFFDKGYQSFFSTLAKRLNEGFDFRVLFLSPDASPDVLHAAHSDSKFRDELLESIRKAKVLMEKSGVPVSQCFKSYKVPRTAAAVVVDDLVLHCPAMLDSEGVAKGFTNAPFSVLDVESPCGKELFKSFDSLWQGAPSL